MAMLANPYAGPAGHFYTQPQAPPSPPLDDAAKCSLPSISNLLDLADQGSPTSETAPASDYYSAPSRPSTRPSSAHYHHGSQGAPGRGALPPTPPMTSEASFGYDSPSIKSVSQLPGNYYLESTPPPQPQQPQQHHYRPHAHSISSVSSLSSLSSSLSQPRHASLPPMQHAPPRSLPMAQTASSSSYGSAAYAAPVPSAYLAQPVAPYYAAPAQPQISGLYFQRPLPQFPIIQPSPWQHHHFISPAAAAAFPQSQDRYICPTCSKAFSRPSSLRIHSHSHTGEKPFKCPHAGCGKAFSVRSNMKRHERGCHNYDGN